MGIGDGFGNVSYINRSLFDQSCVLVKWMEEKQTPFLSPFINLHDSSIFTDASIREPSLNTTYVQYVHSQYIYKYFYVKCSTYWVSETTPTCRFNIWLRNVLKNQMRFCESSNSSPPTYEISTFLVDD